MKKISLICFLMLIASFTFAQKTKENVLKTETKRFEAQINKDTIALNILLDNDLIYIHSNALVERKKDFIRSVTTGNITYQSIKPQLEPMVRLYKNTAIINGIIEVKGLYNADAYAVKLRYTAVYIYNSKKYSLTSWQSTKIL